MLDIPCTPSGSASWQQRTTLAGRDYLLTFAWLDRDAHWWCDIADQDGVPIATGRKLVTSWPLLRGILDPRRPAGELIVFDITGAGADPGFDDLGTRFRLSYVTLADDV